ncbi:hypothetical protein [Vreelandella zhaodongensis]|uniref:Uncharacterized protein n=1 Tax=Vreelandella zhaodongensis TaxID=1176240 RepID=A0ABX2SQ62_VREZH|nr:hypothetical protein [Halomonas zhaodongensis]NYS43694.1 hypothetical protein [Halomonas zhaodongensis]
MTDRANRYAAFDNFREGSKDLFEAYAKSTESSLRLDSLYSFYVSPGGRYGGRNKKIVDVFYGNRPFDSITETGVNFQTIRKLETARGATLSYQRTDDGLVLCSLSPAASENFHHPEDFILLDMVKNPTELERKSKRHWRMFQAYMESTCLDGKPTFFQKILVFYLRNFKEFVADKTLQKRRASVFFREIAKYTVTVGLSGFIILMVNWSKDSIDSNQALERHHEVLSVYSNIAENAKIIAKSSEAIDARIKILDQTTSDNLQSLSLTILESASRIERSLDSLKEANETRAKKVEGKGAQHVGE